MKKNRMSKIMPVTMDMISRGIANGIIVIADGVDGNEPVCRIGDYWFYFTSLVMTAKEYIKATEWSEICEAVHKALRDMWEETQAESEERINAEVMYYHGVISEGLQTCGITRPDKTDMPECRNTAKALLRIPIPDDTPMYPLVVSHPFFSSSMAPGKEGKLLDLSKTEELKEAVSVMDDIIDRAKKPADIMMLLREPYYMTYLKYAGCYMSLYDFSTLLGTAWTSAENVNMDVNVPLDLAETYFKLADKSALMNEDEIKEYLTLPDMLTVYRGVAPGRNPDGMSWTPDLEKAKWFASRFGGNGDVLERIITRSEVLAYFSRRDESEIVVNLFSAPYVV